MLYCVKCGRKLEEGALFCTGCGERVTGAAGQPGSRNAPPKSQSIPPKSQSVPPKSQSVPPKNQSIPPKNQSVPPQSRSVPPQHQPADNGSVQYVYVNKKTGKITHNPRVKTRSEGCVSFFAVALAAVALVIAMVAGSVILSGYFAGRDVLGDNDSEWEVSSDPDVSSQTVSDNNTGYDTPSDPVSSDAVSSQQPEIPDELLADNLQKRIKGKWRTDVPYKSMNLPGTFEFDGNGNCKCTVKAFLFSKKFDGQYTIKDGGECILSIEGLEDYFDNNTMVGQLRFITDDKIEFTVDNTVWKLNRVE